MFFRDPRQRFNPTSVSAVDKSLRRSLVDFQANYDDDSEVSIFATIPRTNRHSSPNVKLVLEQNKIESHSPENSCDHDSVEDLMMNLSITAPASDSAVLQTGHDNQTSDQDIITGSHAIFGGEASVPSSSPYPSHTSIGSSNVFLYDSAEKRRYIPSSPDNLPVNTSDSVATDTSNPNSNLTKLSSTNISHIEHFNQNNTHAVYVTGDDVRRRKKKRRFFSRINKKKENYTFNDEKDTRRFSIYESLHGSKDAELSDRENDAVYATVNHSASHCVKRPYTSLGSNQSLCPSVSSSAMSSRVNINCEAADEQQPTSLPDTPSWTQCTVANFPTTTVLRSQDIEHVDLPPNSCFETAFTSDSPKTRIIPQKSVDTLHLRQIKRRRRNNMNATGMQRPKSIAVPSRYCESDFLMKLNKYDTKEHCSNVSNSSYDLNKSQYNWSTSPSMFDLSSPCQTLSVADLIVEPNGNGGKIFTNKCDHSFNKSLSTGDLHEEHQEQEDWVKCAPDVKASAVGTSTSKGFNLVHRVRDSIRRRKAKDHRKVCKASSSASTSCNSSVCHSINSSDSNAATTRHLPDKSCTNTISSTNIVNACHSTVVFPQTVNYVTAPAAGILNNQQQNVKTLKNLRATKHNQEFLAPLSRYSNDRKPDHEMQCRSISSLATYGRSVSTDLGYSDAGSVCTAASSCVMSPILADDPHTGGCALQPSVRSPFSPSSGCETSDTVSMLSLSDRSVGAVDGDCSVSSLGHFSVIAPATGRDVSKNFSDGVKMRGETQYRHTSVSTTQYSTNLSHQYSSNRDQHPLPNSPLEPTAHLMMQHRSTPVSCIPSRSTSLSSLYTTALACYDESDPHPIAVTSLPHSPDASNCVSIDDVKPSNLNQDSVSSDKSQLSNTFSNCHSSAKGNIPKCRVAFFINIFLKHVNAQLTNAELHSLLIYP